MITVTTDVLFHSLQYASTSVRALEPFSLDRLDILGRTGHLFVLAETTKCKCRTLASPRLGYGLPGLIKFKFTFNL